MDELVQKAAEVLTAEQATHVEEPDESAVDEAEPAPSGTGVTGKIDADRLRTAIAQAERARTLAERRETQLATAKAELEKKYQVRHQQLEQRAEQLAEKRSAHAAEVAEFEQRKAALSEREKSVAERAGQVLQQEEEAKGGFAEMRHEQLARLRREMDERRSAFDRELEEREKRAAERFAATEDDLSSRERALAERVAELEKTRRELERMRRHATAREEFLDQQVADGIKSRRREWRAQLEAAEQEILEWRQRYEKIKELAQVRAEKLAEQETATLEFGELTATEVMAELNRLRARNAELHAAAAAHPVSERERVQEIESRNHDLVLERERLVRENAELRRRSETAKISAIERENSRMINQALESLNKTLSNEIHQQTLKLQELQADSQNSSPFPSCAGMDENEHFARRPELSRTRIELRTLIGRIRARMAADLNLYYSEADLRCFVAGLAASRLHLLQGISGIGKTRLPQAFARVMGAGCDLVAVAAEWRSPQDLMGYYNPFERKFYETGFTQALYKAQLPLFKDKPFFVILDEMNLSHPEQYFSDLLSALESKAGDPSEPARLQLMTAKVEPAPALLHDGRFLELPDNVWFIGTANNDETTVRFAPKTYDRAHVLELPARPVAFDPGAGGAEPVEPMSMRSLDAAFDEAVRHHGSETDRVLGFFDRELGDRLRDDFGSAWGPRLRRQAERLVPVTVAAGGTAGEAADHLLATKILRSLSGRFEIQPTQLRALEEQIIASWGRTFPDTRPEKSVRALRAELKSRGIS
ncbi:hypothetical protein [Actinomadura bangladeshensis]|uniref:ATPase dynein-related AAA domain-containing protein n=1 Tax=Actinomadura bangladeshensis TaxID=453573 RepID=A0A4R4P006_9ACTN|nr:hypothetical protein [Actinomadura bangladeshensis]TDC15511.1 hypothetical protein E1284_15210 [Actinomadura bangladeshensis]